MYSAMAKAGYELVQLKINCNIYVAAKQAVPSTILTYYHFKVDTANMLASSCPYTEQLQHSFGAMSLAT